MATHTTVGGCTPQFGPGGPRSLVYVLGLLVPIIGPLLLAPSRLSAGEDVSDPRVAMAIKFHADGKYEEAATVLEGVLKSNSGTPDVYLWLGRARASLKQWGAARDAFTRYTESAGSQREKADGFRAIARTHAAEKNTGLAKSFYGRALEYAADARSCGKRRRSPRTRRPNRPLAHRPRACRPRVPSMLERVTADSGPRGCSGSAAVDPPGGAG